MRLAVLLLLLLLSFVSSSLFWRRCRAYPLPLVLFFVIDLCCDRLERWLPVNKCQVQRATSRSICEESIDSTMSDEEALNLEGLLCLLVWSFRSCKSSCWASISMVGLDGEIVGVCGCVVVATFPSSLISVSSRGNGSYL